jgi:hypothetical protein
MASDSGVSVHPPWDSAGNDGEGRQDYCALRCCPYHWDFYRTKASGDRMAIPGQAGSAQCGVLGWL